MLVIQQEEDGTVFYLAHSDLMRQRFNFPKPGNLHGEGSQCIWMMRTGQPDPPVTLIRTNPEEACRRVGLTGLERLLLVDDLFAHAQYAAAYDLALYLASSRELFQAQDMRQPTVERALGTVSFLRLLAIRAAIQGGLYRRARSSLIRVERLLPPRERNDVLSCCLRANYFLLWGRLAQVQALPRKALEYFQKAKVFLQQMSVAIPGGIDLLASRSQLDTATANDPLKVAVSGDPDHRPTNVYGAFESHYRTYLEARAASKRRQWDLALDTFGRARSELVQQAHGTLIDPIRAGYLDMGVARTLVGRGLQMPRSPKDLEAGLKALLEVRSAFHQHGFTPGEYVAHRHYCEAKMSGVDEDTSLQLLSSLSSMSHITGVLRFQIESDLQYAQALYSYGRPIAAQAALRYLRPSERDEFSAELETTDLWTDVTAFLESTRHAVDNAVDPLEPWGISEYATRERDFVTLVSEATNDTFVSAYGPAGSGRRLFLERVAEARGLGTNLEVVTAVGKDAQAIHEELTTHLRGGRVVAMYDLNLWPSQAQEQAIHLLAEEPSYRRRAYATLTLPLADAHIGTMLAPRLATLLADGAWMIEPLSSRRRDTLLLARGFLVRSLPRTPDLDKTAARQLIFSRDAARYLRNRYSHIGDLYRAMRFLGHRIRRQYDLLHEGNGYIKVPLETIERHLAPPSPQVSRGGQDSTPLRFGPEIAQADASTVRGLAKQYGGRLSVVAKAAGIPRSTLIRTWEKNEVMSVWYQSEGRTALRTKKRAKRRAGGSAGRNA